jgi:hypothetical protein
MTVSQTSLRPPLVDLLSGPSEGAGVETGELDDALADRAARLIDFALAEHERISGLDIGMGRLALDYTDPQGAATMRRMYQQWADQADELLRRVKSHGLRERLRAKFDALERAVGVTLAMLSIKLDSLRRSAEQINRGEVVSIEEVRRELRARTPN